MVQSHIRLDCVEVNPSLYLHLHFTHAPTEKLDPGTAQYEIYKIPRETKPENLNLDFLVVRVII